MIPVGTLEGFTSLDVSAQHFRVSVALGQPLESLLPSSSARYDDCNQYEDEKDPSDDTSDDWGERELASPVVRASLYLGCLGGRTGGQRRGSGGSGVRSSRGKIGLG